MRTNCKATISLVDMSALDDLTATSTSGSSISSPSLFKREERYNVVQTTERNFAVLDGSLSIASSVYEIPFWSNELSGDECNFDGNPSIIFTFTESHTSTGITMRFNSDYPSEVRITWYTDANRTSKIETKTFHPDSTDFFFRNQVVNFRAVVVEFVKTRLPGQFVKVDNVLIGQIAIWENDDIISATITEEVDCTSATIPIGTCELTLIDKDNEWNIQNEDGSWKSLQTDQKIVIEEKVENKSVPVGEYYLESWKSQSNSIAFSLVDGIGFIDKLKFIGGIYENALVSDIVASIMATARWTDYEVDSYLANIRLSGYIPICSCRDALQQIAFSIGAVISCLNGRIIINVPDKNVDSYILLNRKFSGGTVMQLDEYVSGVSITATQYRVDSDATEIYNGFLPKGINRIEFSEPYTNLSCVGGAIITSNANYCEIQMDNDGDVVLSGVGYITNEFTITKNVDHIENGQIEKIRAFSGLTICNTQLLPSIAQTLLTWYSLRQNVEIEYLCDAEKVGEWVAIEDSLANGKFAITRINSQTIDLTGGYIAKASCKGYSTIVSTYSYMGNDELRMNGEEII